MSNNEDLTPSVETRRLPSPDRHSAPTPLDVRQAKFSTSMRGYERAEVNAFLLEAADGYEQAMRENERLRQEVARLEASLTQYRELEGALKGALMSAQKVVRRHEGDRLPRRRAHRPRGRRARGAHHAEGAGSSSRTFSGRSTVCVSSGVNQRWRSSRSSRRSTTRSSTCASRVSARRASSRIVRC